MDVIVRYQDEDSIAGLSFEEAYAALEEIVSEIETGERSLEESLSLYETGQRLAKRCEQLLAQAELRIQRLDGGSLTDLEPPTA